MAARIALIAVPTAAFSGLVLLLNGLDASAGIAVGAFGSVAVATGAALGYFAERLFRLTPGRLGRAVSDPQSESRSLAFERFKAALENGIRYPQGAAFVDAEAPHAGSTLIRSARLDLPVVLVYPDGVEKIIEAASPPESPKDPERSHSC